MPAIATSQTLNEMTTPVPDPATAVYRLDVILGSCAAGGRPARVLRRHVQKEPPGSHKKIRRKKEFFFFYWIILINSNLIPILLKFYIVNSKLIIKNNIQ
jgi:hypothetical protein